MMSQSGNQLIAMHILPNISRSKSNQTMQFCQLIEYADHQSFFKKQKEKFWTSVPASFFSWFLKKNIYLILY